MDLYGKQWPHEFTNRFFIGQHTVDLDQYDKIPHMLKAIKPREIVTQLADVGCDTLYFYMSCHMGNCYYPTKVPYGRTHSGIGDRDVFGEVADECVKRNVALVAVYEFAHMHYMVDFPTVPQEWKHYVYEEGNLRKKKLLCWNTGYGDFVLSQIDEVFSTYPVYGLYVDMLDYPQLNMCEGCRERFMNEMGKDPPHQGTDIHSPLYKEFRMWSFREEARFQRKIRDAVRKHVPGATVVNNYHWMRCEDLYEELDAVDYVSTDPGIGYGYASMTTATHTPAVFRTLSEGKPPFDVLYDDILCGLIEIAQRDPYLAVASHALAHGGYPVADSMWNQDGALNPPSLGLAREVYKHVDACKPWVGNARPLRGAGLYISQETKYLYTGIGDLVKVKTPEYEESVSGALMALNQEHVITDILTKRQLGRLGEYALIYLPNVVCLSEKELDLFREYVRNGGTLVSTYRTSLCDEWANPQGNFRLADVFGVDWTGEDIEPYIAVQMNLCEPGAFDLQPWENPSVTVNRQGLVVKVRPGARALAMLHDRYRPETRLDKLRQLRNAFVKEDPAGPAIVEHRYGKGRSLYFAPRVFGAYAQKGVPLIRKLSTRWLVGEERKAMPVTLEAPCSVKITAWQRPERAQWILHLVNLQSVPADAYNETKDEKRSIPLTEEVLPVHDLTLTLRKAGKQVKRAWLPLSDQDLVVGGKHGEGVVEVPRVHVHEIVVVEFDAPWEAPEDTARFEFAPMITCPDEPAQRTEGASGSPARTSAGEEPEERDDLGAGQE